MVKERLSLASNILSSNFGRLPFPYKLTLVLTYWCNYKCKTCNIWQKRPEDELTSQEITTFFQNSNRFNWIDFTGGEIWMRNDFVSIVESSITHCKNLALIHFPTNGFYTQKTVEGVKEILKMNPPKLIITVSLDGDEETNDEIRGKQGGWKKQIDTFRQLKELKGVDTVLGMTLSKHNAGKYKETFEAVKKVLPDLHHKDFHVNIAHESSHFYNNSANELTDNSTQDLIIGELEQYKRSRGPTLGPVSFLENRYLGKVKQYLDTGKTPVRCHSLSASCFIDSWGNVYPCVTYDHKLGNIRDHGYDLEKIWNLPETQTLQKEISNGQCPQCWQPCEAYQSIMGNLI
jgi:MoaA/NifB/PqqE/SkfB family radical SAM enzyme